MSTGRVPYYETTKWMKVPISGACAFSLPGGQPGSVCLSSSSIDYPTGAVMLGSDFFFTFFALDEKTAFCKPETTEEHEKQTTDVKKHFKTEMLTNITKKK